MADNQQPHVQKLVNQKELDKALNYQARVKIGKGETVYGPVRMRKEDTEPDGSGDQMQNAHPLLNSQQFASQHTPQSVITYENTDPDVRAELKQEQQQKLANQAGISSAPTATRSG